MAIVASAPRAGRRMRCHFLTLSAALVAVLGLHRLCFTGVLPSRAGTARLGAAVPRHAGVISIPGDLKKGILMLVDDVPYEVLEFLNKKVGKGVAVCKTKLKNLYTGGIIEKTLQNTKKYEEIETEWQSVTYSYYDEEWKNYVFMDMETFDELTVSKDVLGEKAVWISDGQQVDLNSYGGKIIGFQIKGDITAKVVELEQKADSETKNSIRVTLDNGEQMSGPFYLKVGDEVLIDGKNFNIQKRVNA